MLKEKLQQARLAIECAIEELDQVPEKDAIADLIEACRTIDTYYRRKYCSFLIVIKDCLRGQHMKKESI